MPEYEWLLCKSPSHTDPYAPLEKIGDLHNAKNRALELVKNRAGTASFSIRTSDDMAYEILDQVDLNDIRGTLRKAIRVRRNKEDLWSGKLWGIQGSLDQGELQITCAGWQETELQYRMLWPATALDYSNNGNGTPPSQIVLGGGGVTGLLDHIIAQDPNHPPAVQKGQVFGNVDAFPRNRYYQRGQMLGPAIQELSDIEAGFDYMIDPVTRELNLAAWDLYKTEMGWWGGIRDDIVLGYNWGPNNLKDVQWAEDPSRMCDNMYVQSLGAPVGPIYDPVAQDEYGLFEELVSLSGANQNVLQPYGVAELVIRSRPLVTWTVVPHPPSGKMPVLFDDFQIGDQIAFTARKDAVKINEQAIRVFGASVSLDDNDNETVSGLQLAPATAG